MIGQLPTALSINGFLYNINADFRNVLIIFEALADTRLTDEEKAFVCLKRLYYDEIPIHLIEEAIKQAYWFCDGGDIPKTEPEKVKIIDWKHDESILLPAVSKAAGVVDVRSVSFLHWWTFLGLFGEIGDGLFSTVMNMRQKLGKGKPLEKWEREFYNKNKNLIKLRTAEEQAEIDETEEFLRSIT